MRFFVILAFVAACGLGSDAFALEKKLIADLLKGYDFQVRPVGSRVETVPVKFGIGLGSVEAGPNNFFSLQGWMKLFWTDADLHWDYRVYGDVTQIKLYPHILGQNPSIWTPDITLYQGRVLPSDATAARAFITQEGNVTYFPHHTFKVQCHPVASAEDKVICKLRFGSWVYGKAELDLQVDDTSCDNHLQASSGWRLTDSKLEKKDKTYDCCPDEIWPYIDVSLTLQKNANASATL